ncbi:PEP-CTERM sorting domain-containing protein [Geminocystis sp.]|uniref:PEP-CTERM sorting domain-containing protein n=1 Tax=Geminocystis sp. TaxID=2664100 RepID=UPI0035936771
MKSTDLVTILSTVALGLMVNTLSAEAISFTSLSNFTDTDFNNAKSSTNSNYFTQPWQEDWVAEVRGGNNATNGTYELSVNNWTTNNGTDVTYPSTQQNIFTSGQAVDFSVSYDGTNATFLWGTNLGTSQKTLQSSNLTEASRFPNGLDSIFIRLRSRITTPINSFQLSNLNVNGVGYGGSLLADNSDNLNYLLITGLNDNFTLTGTAVLSWEGAIPNNSNLDMTIKMGYGAVPTNVPEPSTIIATLTALGLGSLMKKKVH